MQIHTRLCDQLGITHPILNAPMGGGDAPAALAAAVSRAGGLGMIGGTTAGGPRWLVDEILRARDLTDRPIGVGLLSHRPDAWRLMNSALEHDIKVIAHSFADPTPFVAWAHEADALVICQVRTLDGARRAVDAGVDAITAQGTEAGGHTGHLSTLALVPAIVDAVAPFPVIAAGGIGDGRTIAAALMLGAEGVWIGTRLLATHECGVSEPHKRVVIAATTDDTVLTDVFDIATATPWPAGVSGRAIRDEFSDRWSDRPDELRAFLRRSDEVASNAPGALAVTAFWAGEGTSCVTNREHAADVVEQLAASARAVLAERSAALLRYVFT